MNIEQVRNILNILFMILAVIAVICYFTASFTVFIYVCAAAIFLKLAEFFIRFMF
jgi:hypothetical protein